MMEGATNEKTGGNIDLPYFTDYWMNRRENDCNFVVGEERERIGAVRIFLQGQSEPLRVMLGTGPLAETGDIHIPDVEPDDFKTFLKCIYGGGDQVIPTLPFEQAIGLLYIVEKYLVECLKPKLVCQLGTAMRSCTFTEILSYPICFQIKELDTSLMDAFSAQAKEILLSEQYLSLPNSVRLWLVRHEDLELLEVQIWRAVVKWAKLETGSNDGKILRDRILQFLKFIRFCAMSCDEFCQEVVVTNILLPNEISEICKAFGSSYTPVLEYICTSKVPRCKGLMTATLGNTSANFSASRTAKMWFKIKVGEVTTLGFRRSAAIPIGGFSWAIMVSLNVDSAGTYLSVFVDCIHPHYTWMQPWDCSVFIQLSLLNKYQNTCFVNPTTPKLYVFHRFPDPRSRFPHQHGFPQFYKWEKILDPEEGIVTNDGCIVVGASLTLNRPNMHGFHPMLVSNNVDVDFTYGTSLANLGPYITLE